MPQRKFDVHVPILTESMPTCSFIQKATGQLLCATHDYEENWLIASALGAQAPCLELLSRWPDELCPPELEDLRHKAKQQVQALRRPDPTMTAGQASRMARHWNYMVRAQAAGSGNCPENILLELAQDSQPEPRIAAAKNRNLPARGYAILSEDRTPAVRQGLALNANCPEEMLQRMTSDSSPIVSSAAKLTLAEQRNFARSRALRHR